MILVARTEQKADQVLRQLASEVGNDRLHTVIADLSVQSDIRHLAAEIARRCSRLDVLVNNAGVISPERFVTPDGIELTWAVNHLAPFLLTNLLTDLLVNSAPARVVTVASRSQGRGIVDLSDVQFERRPYDMLVAYAQSKLANVMFTVELARRLQGTGVTANCLHPGFVATNLGRRPNGDLTLLWRIVRRFAASADRGARTSLYLSLSPDVTGATGRYFVGRNSVAPNPLCGDAELTSRLWAVSETMTKLSASD